MFVGCKTFFVAPKGNCPVPRSGDTFDGSESHPMESEDSSHWPFRKEITMDFQTPDTEKLTPRKRDSTAQASDRAAIRPFRFNAPEAELIELRRRVAATRWPEKETVTDQSQGVQLATIQALARYWATDYDWRKAEARLNALPHFITEIDGLDIHFIHVRSKHENALPLIVTHGWPGSILEQMKIIDPLTNPTAHGGSASDALRCRDSVDARLRLFRQADHDRLGPRPHRTRLDRADEAPRIHEVRGAGWRLGCDHHRAHGRAGAAGIAGHSHQHGERDSTRHRQAGLFRRAGAGRISRPTRSSLTSG